MNKYDIIRELSENRVVEEMITNIAKNRKFEYDDLAQDVYVWLLEEDDDKVIQLYENKQLKYWVSRMLVNNIHSTTSPFYTKYRKFMALGDNEYIEDDGNDEEAD